MHVCVCVSVPFIYEAHVTYDNNAAGLYTHTHCETAMVRHPVNVQFTNKHSPLASHFEVEELVHNTAA